MHGHGTQEIHIDKILASYEHLFKPQANHAEINNSQELDLEGTIL
jgi:hypothetical protein